MQLIQTCIIHCSFLGIQEFNDLIKFDIIFSFKLKRAFPSGLAAYFFNHINRIGKIILANIYDYIKRQKLTQLFRF